MQDRKSGGDGRSSSEVNTRAVSRGQNELIGKFNQFMVNQALEKGEKSLGWLKMRIP